MLPPAEIAGPGAAGTADVAASDAGDVADRRGGGRGHRGEESGGESYGHAADHQGSAGTREWAQALMAASGHADPLWLRLLAVLQKLQVRAVAVAKA